MSLGQYWLEVAILAGIGIIGWLTMIPFFYTSMRFGIAIAKAADAEDAGTQIITSVGSTMFGLLVSLLFSVTVGLIAAHAVGLGAPFIEARIEGVTSATNTAVFMPTLIRSVEYGAGIGILGLLFNATTKFSKGNAGLWAASQVSPLWQRILMLIGTPVSIIIVMSGIAIFAWLLGLIWHQPDKMPANWVFWVAIGLIVLFYSIQQVFQLVQAAQILEISGWTITLLFVFTVIMWTVIGYILWKDGLEAACVVMFVSSTITTLLGR